MKIFILIGLIVAQVSVADPVKKGKHQLHHRAAKAAKKTGDERAKLQTDINFNDSVLHGRYETPDEANAKIENEKVLSDLLAVRTNFKDRLKKSSGQN